MALVIAVRSDEIDVVSTGTLMLRKGKSAKFFFSGIHGIGFHVELSFEGEGAEEGLILGAVVSSEHFQLTFKNFSSPFGTVNTEPIYVANHDGRRVYLNIATTLFGGGTEKEVRVVHYQLGIGGPV